MSKRDKQHHNHNMVRRACSEYAHLKPQSKSLRIRDPKNFRPRFEVGEYAILTALRNNKHWCMLSRTIAISLPNCTRLDVTAAFIRFTLMGYRFIYMTPHYAARQVARYDDGIKVRPFGFRLAKPLVVTPVHNRAPDPLPAKRRKPYVRSGKHIACKRASSRRWHGLTVRPPKAA